MGLKCNGKKAKFNDKVSADNKIKEILESGDIKDKTPIRSYKCICGKYHITSLPQKNIDLYKQKVNYRVLKKEKAFINRETDYFIKNNKKSDKKIIKKFRDNNNK